MTPAQLRPFLDSEAAKPFSGWDFSRLDGRIVEAPLAWSYPSLILARLHGANPPRSLLDMGTGGGEFLARLAPFPPHTCATEAWLPNVPIAAARLAPLGVTVVPIPADPPTLPFADGEFDLIINRHEYYLPAEIRRILAPGGLFITQQVGGRNDVELKEMLGAPVEPPRPPWDGATAAAELAAAGLDVLDARDCQPMSRIFDAGAIAYYFTALPWEIPDFSVDAYFDKLLAIHRQIEQHGYIETTLHRFLVIAQKQ
jgi:SAM-dependent methyltransferase